MSEKIIIECGHKLSGTVMMSGAKNRDCCINSSYSIS